MQMDAMDPVEEMGERDKINDLYESGVGFRAITSKSDRELFAPNPEPRDLLHECPRELFAIAYEQRGRPDRFRVLVRAMLDIEISNYHDAGGSLAELARHLGYPLVNGRCRKFAGALKRARSGECEEILFIDSFLKAYRSRI